MIVENDELIGESNGNDLLTDEVLSLFAKLLTAVEDISELNKELNLEKLFKIISNILKSNSERIKVAFKIIKNMVVIDPKGSS